MSGGGGRAVIGSFIWVLRVHYEGVAGYDPVLARPSNSSRLTTAPRPGTRSYGQVP